jgi:hypothetical protein
MKEVRVYLINLHDCRVKDMDNILELTDEEFMFEAEEQGKVYSLKGFQKAFNLEEVNIATDQMRIIEVETSSPGWEFDKTKPIEYMCNLCGGMFPKKEMDFDVKSEEDFTDVCKNCNYTSYNDSPYGDNPLDNHINTMASMIKNLTNPKTK